MNTQNMTPDLISFLCSVFNAYNQGGPQVDKDSLQYVNPTFLLECVEDAVANERLTAKGYEMARGYLATHIPSTKTLARHYQAWCNSQRLPCMSADELICEDNLSPAQRQWLAGFSRMWLLAERRENEDWDALSV